ncbi:MAG: HDIG domain-containing protein [Ignavibacteriae bacterium]|nr:MAG: HDIG domain-containing protein [Ignavibacteriota bacterium]
MAKQNKTLFAQLREESEAAAQRPTVATSKVIRWVIIVAALLGLAALFPGMSGDPQQRGYDRTLLGTMWTQESVTAEYSYPVGKEPSILTRQRDSARRSTIPIYRPVNVGSVDAAVTSMTFSTVDVERTVRRLASDIRSQLPDKPLVDVIQDSSAASLIVRHPDGSERIVAFGDVVTMSTIRPMIDRAVASVGTEFRDEIKSALSKIIRPSLVHDAQRTNEARELAASSVLMSSEIVRKGDVIIRKGQRIDERTLLRLTAYRNAQYLRSDNRFSVFVILGSLGHAALILAFVILYLVLLRPISFNRNGQLGTLLALPLITAFLGWLSVRIDTILPIEYAVFVPALAMIVTILYEERIALMVTVAMAVSVGAARGDDYAIALVLMIGSTFGVYSVRNVQSRTQIFTSIIAIFIGLVGTTIAIELERAAPIETMWPKALMATANAVISPLLTFALIILFERVFNVATDMRLEEFDDLNHPLLKKLNERAPGTYQHTLAVARLSEAAANAIDANALLTRVGAYFHDIGKLEKSEYFVENQINIDNKHDRLPPKKSAAIIRQHVQDGIELAKEYHLPERIWKFIPMHHGTILIKHFYNRAVDEALLKEIAVDEADFRYPGPRPDSKEAAIVMLADATEALSRLVNTSQRDDIEAAVEQIIVDRMMDGQLSNTTLTLRDLDTIKETFVKNLIGASHKRIRYQEDKK